MSKFATKVASVAITATTVLSLSGLGSFAGVAAAQTVDIAGLLAQIAVLQAQIAALQGGSSMAGATACALTRDLTVGAKGADVTCLQNALIAGGHLGAGYNTGYFGALTKAAVMKWQAAAGVTPVSGYFGPKSRAAFAVMAPTTPTTPTTPAPVVNPTTSLWVAAGAGAPTGSAIAGAGQINVGRFSFTAPATTGVTVSGMTFTKVGVVSDSNISNLYIADVNTGAVVAQYQSLSSNVATFSGLALNVAAGQTAWYELRADISTSATSGNTIAFDLTGVTTAGNTAVAGLPVKGNVLTVTSVSNPAIATVSMTETTNSSANSSVDAGTNSVLVSQWTVSVTNSPVYLRSLQFSFVGSANPGDVRNLRLMVNGTQIATLPTATTETVFSMNANPLKLQTGNSTLQIFADVAGSPNRTFRFSLLQPYKANFQDSQYSAGITSTVTNTSYSFSINTGSITAGVASDSPTTAVPAGASGVVIGKFTVYAAGEAVKVKFLDAKLTVDDTDWATAAGVTDDIQNVRLVTDNGDQIGNSISTVADGSTTGTCTLATSSANCHFGTSSSPINYIIPANTTRTISVIADILSGTNIGTIYASLPGNSSNLEGQVSFQSASSGIATGATRSVNSSPLVASLNTGLTFPTYIAGAVQAKVASFVLTASSAQAADVSSLTFDKDSNATFDMQNLTIKIGSNMFGTARATVGDSESSMSFYSATPVRVPAGGSVTVDVYADVLTTTTATDHDAVVDLTGWSAVGATSGSSITMSPSSVDGQDITISSGPTLTVTLGSNSAAGKNIVMGSTGNELATFRFTNNNVDDVRITDLVVYDAQTNGSSTASFQNISLYDGATLVAGPVSMTSISTASGTMTFALTGNGVIVTKNGAKELTLKADVPTYSSGGAISNSSHVFKVQQGRVTAKSVGSPSATVTVTVTDGTASGNTIKVYRTKLALSSSVLGSTSNRARTGVDDVATLNFAADSAYQAVVQSVILKFTGAAVTSGGTAFTVDLIDSNTNSALGSASQATCTPGQGNSCLVTFNPTYTVSAGTSKATKIRVNSSSFNNTASASDALTVLVNATTDVTFNDGTTASIPLEGTVVPFTVASMSYE